MVLNIRIIFIKLVKNSNFNESLYVEHNRLNVKQFFLSKENFFEKIKSTPKVLASFEYILSKNPYRH